ncbi:dual specificity protein phosphatase 1 [Biomphalaria glabrata]|nr:dual specificity protein phosphatase 1-like [Biomphalaria glabrata]
MEAVCGLTVLQVSDMLATRNADHILIIDCRSFMAYNQGRIVQSVNIHCPPILKRRSGGFIALENIVPCDSKRADLLKGAYPTVLVYDECTVELTQAHSDSSLLSVIKSLLKQVGDITVRYIKGGFEAVQEECPVLCRRQDTPVIPNCREKLSHKDRRRPSPQTEPAEILPHLYLGDVSHSSQRPLLDQMGITALLNVSSTCGNHFQSHFRYMNVQVNDNMDADLFSWFPKIIEFIDNVAAEDGKVLVHCRAGVSRSATVCIAYIMQKRGLSLDSAFEFVMTRRPIIDPNLNFIQQLQRFETNLKSKHQLSISTTSTTFSFPHHADHLLATNDVTSSAFSFSNEDVGEHHVDMDTTFSKEDILSQADMYHHHQFVSLQPIPSPSAGVTGDLNLSPSSISQTAASPSPVWTLGLPASRPDSLPLLQISTPLPRASLLTSPSHSVPYLSPLLEIFQGPSEAAEAFSGNYTNEPKTPLPPRSFSFFGSDTASCPVPLPLDISPRQCRPTTPTALDVSSAPYLNSEDTFPTVVAHSPLSPIGVPLSPLPSFG